MKLLLENFKKNIKEQYRGPTDDPSFSDPGYNEPPGYDRARDESDARANALVQQAMGGEPIKLPNGDMVSYEDFGGGQGQFILNQSEVYVQGSRDDPNGEEAAEEKISDMLIDFNAGGNPKEQKMNLESLIEKLYENKSRATLNENSRTEFIATVATKVISNLTEGLDIEEQDDPVGMRDTQASKLKNKGAVGKDLKKISSNIASRLSGSTPEEYNTIIKLFDKLAVLSQRGGKFDSGIRRRLEQLFSLINKNLGVDDQDGNYLTQDEKPKQSPPADAGTPPPEKSGDNPLQNVGSRRIRDKMKARNAAPVTKLNRVPTPTRSNTQSGRAPGMRGQTRATKAFGSR
jgi:hypothetical protein